MTPNYITLFLSTRSIVYIPQLFHFLEVVEAVMFSYYVNYFRQENEKDRVLQKDAMCYVPVDVLKKSANDL